LKNAHPTGKTVNKGIAIMIILAPPSVSPYLTKALLELEEPVLISGELNVPMRPALTIIDQKNIEQDPKFAYKSLILTSSENALSALFDLIPHDDRVLKSKIFKNKVAFRQALSKRYPQFFFRQVATQDLGLIDVSTLPFPLIMKPATGISSIGVAHIQNAKEWNNAVRYLQEDIDKYKNHYTTDVVNCQYVILEEYIQGPELAVDGFFDSQSEPVILNILEHLFLNERDTSDRLYYTRRSLIKKYYDPLMHFLKQFGDTFDLKRFAFHLELRVKSSGEFVPIELNPLRFSGMGTTEIAEFAYAINVYKHFFKEKKPDWAHILSQQDDSVYAFACMDVPSALFRQKGLRIEDRALYQQLGEVLEYRILSETETSTFAVVFFRSQDLNEAHRVLAMRLDQFLSIDPKAT